MWLLNNLFTNICVCPLIVLFFLFLFKEATIHNLPISHDNPPCFTKNLEKPLFLIPLGIIVAPREIQNSASASFLVCLFVCFFGRGAYYGRCENEEFETKFSNKEKLFNSNFLVDKLCTYALRTHHWFGHMVHEEMMLSLLTWLPTHLSQTWSNTRGSQGRFLWTLVFSVVTRKCM